MSNFILKLKKNTRSVLNKVDEEDIKLFFESYIEDWKDEMEERSRDGYNHFYIWKFSKSENVLISNEKYDITTDDREYEDCRKYTTGQFFNSRAFKKWILDLFPDCKLHYDSMDGENYSIRLSWS